MTQESSEFATLVVGHCVAAMAPLVTIAGRTGRRTVERWRPDAEALLEAGRAAC